MMRIEGVLAVVSVDCVASTLLGFHLALFFVCFIFLSLQCTKCNSFVYLCCQTFFFTNIGVRLFCFINKSLVQHFCGLCTLGLINNSFMITV